MNETNLESQREYGDEDTASPELSFLETYSPLLIIVAASFGAGFALYIESGFDIMRFMAGFMGLFLLILSLFKLFDLPGFVKGFSMYDFAAGRWPLYAYLYPFIELGLGLAYLSGVLPLLVNLLTAAVMLLGAAGILRVMVFKEKRDVLCACVGTVLKIPLGTISLLENCSMAIMAIVMIWIR